MPDLNTLLAGLLAAGLAGGLVLLCAGIRGTRPDPTRPPSRTTDWWLAVRSSPLLTVRLAGGLLLGVLVFAVTGWPVAAVGLAALVVCWPALTGGTAVEARQIQRLEALVGWTEALRDTVSAHAGLEQAIPATAPNAAPVIRPALMRLVGLLRTRVPLEDALLDLAEQLDHGADLIIAALINNVRRRGDGLSQVFGNLLQNALRYTPAPGRVMLRGARRNGEVRIDVHNTGPGIPAADLPHVFERFYRVEKSRDVATGGAGIGLAIVRELALAMGGDAHVEPIDSVGTRFVVTFPSVR